tara:strand:- start:7804 stop:8139 length:336 start_codon:yes stop_codon:yes gene_type:complete
MANELYANSDFSFTVTVYDTDGITVIPASTYLNATWRLFATGSCVPLVSKDLATGITVVGQDFVVTYEKADITVSGIDGEYLHQFRVGTTASEELPAIINATVPIVDQCPA